LSLLKNQRLPAARREYVLDQLITLLRAASRGQQIMAEQALFVGADDRSAYESYSLFARYLHDQDWKTRLEASQDALRRLETGAPASTEGKSAAIHLLAELLKSLESDASTGLPLAPEELHSTHNY
jgi:hypothetical protein